MKKLFSGCFISNITRRSLFVLLTIIIIVFPVFLGFAKEVDLEKSVLNQAPDKIEPVKAPFKMKQPLRPAFPDKIFNIKNYGAVEGGKHKNTRAIAKTIAAAAEAGGGRVLIPEGVWLTGSIHLENNIDLHITENAVLSFSDLFKDYLPPVFSRHEGMECYKYASLIYANSKKNIAVTGRGKLHGNGKAWWKYQKKKTIDHKVLHRMIDNDIPVKERIFDGTKNDMYRPAFFQPINCTNVLLEGLTFMYGPFWTINLVYCENVIVRKVKIITEGDYGHTPNGDGINPDSSRNVLIEYCDLDTGDDCIAIKSGRSKDGLRVGRPSENIVVRYCRGRRGHGGVVCGSETSGGVKNVFIRNCLFTKTDRGLRFKTARGRGAYVKNIWAQDLEMREIKKESILVTMLRYTKRFPEHALSDLTPIYDGFHFKNIISDGASTGISLIGLPERPMENITFTNITMKKCKKGGIKSTDARRIILKNVNIETKGNNVMEFTDSSDVIISDSKCTKEMKVFVQLNGKRTKNIRLINNNTSKANKAVSLDTEVEKDAFSIE